MQREAEKILTKHKLEIEKELKIVKENELATLINNLRLSTEKDSFTTKTNLILILPPGV